MFEMGVNAAQLSEYADERETCLFIEPAHDDMKYEAQLVINAKCIDREAPNKCVSADEMRPLVINIDIR